MPPVPAPLGPGLEWLADGLLRASTYGAVFIGVVWVVCRLAPRLPAAARSLLWWCAALKLLVDFVWLSPIPVPVLPPPAGATLVAAGIISDAGPAGQDATATGVAQGSHHTVGLATYDTAGTPVMSRLVAIGLVAWGVGVALAVGRMVRRGRRTMAVVARSAPAPEAMSGLAADLSSRLGLRRTPRIRVSAGVETPLVAGLVRPVVLLPARRMAGLCEREQRMALCHELAHVRRADLWLGCVPALAEGLFFFHPLAHLAAREYALGREAACDAVVLGVVDAAPQEYGRLLLGLGVARLGRGLAAAGAPWSFSILKRRIAMLRDSQAVSFRTRIIAGTVVALAVLALVPLQLVARTSPPSFAGSTQPDRPAAVLPAGPMVAGAPAEAGPAPAAAPLIANQAQRKPQAERDLSYVLFYGDDKSTMSSGSTGNIERARQFRRPGESLLWFRLEGKEYIVRDAALLRQIEEIWRPVHEIGNEQGKLGARQGELGAKQGDLGRKQGELGAQQGAIGARQGSLGARQGALANREVSEGLTTAQKAEIEKEHQQIEREMRELEGQMKQLGAKMKEFEQPMRELGDQMEGMGKEMEILGRKMQEASATAEKEMQTLLDRAIASGLAQPVK
jgi:beta-lactamase regulating signal transducer with metallopeptidase domain